MVGVCCCSRRKATRRMSRKLGSRVGPRLSIAHASLRPITPPYGVETLPAQQRGRHHGAAVKGQQCIGGSFTANVGSGRSSRFYSSILAPQRLLVRSADDHPRAAETLVCSCGVDSTMHKESQRRKSTKLTENAIQITHRSIKSPCELSCCLAQRYKDCAATKSRRTSSSAAVNFCSSSSLPMTFAA